MTLKEAIDKKVARVTTICGRTETPSSRGASMSCTCPESNWYDGKGHDLGCPLWNKPMSNTTLGVQKDFARRLAEMHAEAGRLGLYLTMHKIHEAVKQVGYEMAGTPELYDKIEKHRQRASR